MVKLRKVLCIALASMTLVGGSVLISSTTGTDLGSITVSAASYGRAACLSNCELTGHKTYETKFNCNATFKKFYIWRSDKQLVSVRSSNSSVAKICKDENGTYFRTGSADDLGKAVVTAKYKDGTTDIISVKFEAVKTSYNIGVGQTKNYNYTGGKSAVKYVKLVSGNDVIAASKNGVNFKIVAKKEGTAKVRVIYENGVVEIRTFNVVNSVKCEKKYTYNQFMNMGVVNYQGKRFTYYSQSVLSGTGLKIPGRHVQDGFVSDKDGYICLASPNLSKYPKGATINTPFGRKGKFYDYCPGGSFDVYVK